MSPRADRTMPAVSSPLSSRSQPVDIPSQARRRPALNARQSSNGPATHLRLPSLPRFHPANYATQSSSCAATPVTGPNSPSTPVSLRTNMNRQYEAQRQMYLYQQQILANTSRQVRSGPKPNSPRLAPLASPGAVTPLELENDTESYLTAGLDPASAVRHVETLIRQEARRCSDYSPNRSN
ncbi:hypothetical protein ACN47E_002634 [Coniothyrium glycines]